MLVPTKFTKLEESTIFKMRCIVAEARQGESVLDIYNRTKDNFHDASEFLHAMDIVFILDMIEVEFQSGEVEYA